MNGTEQAEAMGGIMVGKCRECGDVHIKDECGYCWECRARIDRADRARVLDRDDLAEELEEEQRRMQDQT